MPLQKYGALLQQFLYTYRPKYPAVNARSRVGLSVYKHSMEAPQIRYHK